MKRRKLKPVVKIVSLALVLTIFSIVLLINVIPTKISEDEDEFVYVNDYIFDNYLPVINKDEVLIRPYSDENVSVYKGFYDKDKSKEEQEKALIYYENIYMQNSGIDYSSENEFNILSSVSGTVINITDDDLLGKTVEIRNSNGITTTYQCLSEINVKKSDIINQGQIIGKSGTCNLYKDVKNVLHFELYINGSIVNPDLYYDKIINNQSNKTDEE